MVETVENILFFFYRAEGSSSELPNRAEPFKSIHIMQDFCCMCDTWRKQELTRVQVKSGRGAGRDAGRGLVLGYGKSGLKRVLGRGECWAEAMGSGCWLQTNTRP